MKVVGNSQNEAPSRMVTQADDRKRNMMESRKDDCSFSKFLAIVNKIRTISRQFGSTRLQNSTIKKGKFAFARENIQ